MHRRLFSPYSQIGQIRARRRELIILVVSAIFLGVLLSILATILHDILVLGQNPTGREWLALGVGSTVSILCIMWIAWVIPSRTETQAVRIQIPVPYNLEGGRKIQVSLQQNRGPRYRPAVLARQRFAAAYRNNSLAERQLLADWQTAQQTGTHFPEFFGPCHKDLVDCLILEALHLYTGNSLSSRAPFQIWQSPSMPSYSLDLKDLPQSLQKNPFVQALIEESPAWKLLLPKGVQLDLEVGGPGERTWVLSHRLYGKVIINCLARYWPAGYSHKVGRVLGAALKPAQLRWFIVLGSRIEATAILGTLALFPRGDPFHEWATGLLSFLEEGLDWTYYDQDRQASMLATLSNQIGEVPSGSSLSDKLTAIEEKLQHLDSQRLDKTTMSVER